MKKTLQIKESVLRNLVTESVRVLLREGLEVWKDGGQADKLAKQIYVDFKDAAIYGVTKIEKTYTYRIDDYDVPVIVKLDTHGNTQGWWSRKERHIEMFIGGKITLQLNDIRETLFHEITHAYDFLRRKEGKGLEHEFSAKQAGVLLNGRNTKLTKQINDIIYLLYTPTEVNAWQNVVTKGQKGIDKYINRINKQLDDLATNNRLKHEEMVYAYLVPRLLKTKHTSSGREYNGWEYKNMFIADARRRVELLKRKLYKNLAHYQGYADDNLEGFQNDAKVQNQATATYREQRSLESEFCEAVTERIQDLAEGIVRRIYQTLEYDWTTGNETHPVFTQAVYDASSDSYPFSIKVKPYKNRMPKVGWNPKTRCLDICSLIIMDYVYKARNSQRGSGQQLQYWWAESVKAAMRAICNAAPKSWMLQDIIQDSYGLDIMRKN